MVTIPMLLDITIIPHHTIMAIIVINTMTPAVIKMLFIITIAMKIMRIW